MDAATNISPKDGWIQRREQRHKVLIRARMRAGALPVEVCISDVSPHGICAITAAPPARGTFVEVTDIASPMVGQVVWSSNRRFGIAVGQTIDLGRFLAQTPSARAARELVAPQAGVQKPSAASLEQLSREVGRAMQFSFAGAAGLVAALLIGELVYNYLSQAADAVAAGLQVPH